MHRRHPPARRRPDPAGRASRSTCTARGTPPPSASRPSTRTWRCATTSTSSRTCSSAARSCGTSSLDEETWRPRPSETLTSLAVTTVRSIRQLVASLSGGQRQSVAIAKAVLWNSEARDHGRADGGARRRPDRDGARPGPAAGRPRARGADRLAQHERRVRGRRPDRRAAPRAHGRAAARPPRWTAQIVVDLMTTGDVRAAPATGSATPDARERTEARMTDRSTSRSRRAAGRGPTRELRRRGGCRRRRRPRRRARSPTRSATTCGVCVARIRGGESGVLPVVGGLLLISILFQIAQLELPDRRQPGQPADPGRGLHAAGDGRGLRRCCSARSTCRSGSSAASAAIITAELRQADVRLAVVGGDRRRACSSAPPSAPSRARSSPGSACRRSSSRWPACSAGRA